MHKYKTVPKILLVDDEPKITRPLARVFELLGYDVGIAGSGQEALDCLQDERHNLVLLDLCLPGMDGLEFLTQAQSLAPDAIFIILTANIDLDSSITALRLGVFDYLIKPCPIEEIIDVVRRGLREHWPDLKSSLLSPESRLHPSGAHTSLPGN